MPLCLLDRTVLTETARLTVFYAVAYLALVSVALVVPLLDKGAPLGSVLAVLPGQLPFPATIVLPMALSTAVIATLGRMREDGELVALQAAGISGWRMPLGILPLVLLLLVIVTWLAHAGMPAAYRSFREAKSALARQAITTKVAREEPVLQLWHTRLTALRADGQRLHDVFAWHRDPDGNLLYAYAPLARWVTDPADHAGNSSALRLQLEEARPLFVEPDPTAGPTLTGLDFPNLVVDIPLDLARFDQKPEGKDTAQLLQATAQIAAVESSLAAASDLDELLPALLRHVPDRIAATDLADWPRTLRRLHDPDFTLAALIDEQTRAGLTSDAPLVRERALAAWNAALPRAHDILGTRPRFLPGPIAQLIDSGQLPADLQTRANHLLVRQLASEAFTFDDLEWVLLEDAEVFGYYRGQGFATAQREMRERNRRELVGHQMAWHLRLVLSLSVLSYACFATGLGLSLSSRNRLLAAAIGLAVVVVTLIPGVAAVKGMRGKLPIHPGWILWTPQVLVAAIGCWLVWRRR